MTLSRINSSAATLSKNRTEDSISSLSGMCATCIDGCIGMCEVGKSAYRGSEMIYPQPFGIITTASEKRYSIDLSHFTILGNFTKVQGIEADSDKVLFPNVNLETKVGRNDGIKFKLPIIIPALGSTRIAKDNWDGLAIGAALSGISLTVGENVCGMDADATFKNGRLMCSPELVRRVETFNEWRQDGYGTVIIQANVEDTRLGVYEYAISELGVEAVELKWGQGAKDIGGEVKIKDLERAQLLKKRGYIMMPDPDEPSHVKDFKAGRFREFERHSRVGIVTMDSFLKRVDELRSMGAKYIFLKTGAYRPADLARAIKFASMGKIDVLTVDGAGGGTGMSPWRMMNEWGVPPVMLHSLLYKYANKLDQRGEFVPDIVISAGFAFEDQIFKGLALGAPYFKLIGMARAPLAAAMVGKTIGKTIEARTIPVYIARFGTTAEDIFITASELKQKFGEDFNRIPAGALGFYTYMQRLSLGLQQIMAGNRKFALKYISRNDIAALTKDAAEVSGIPYITDVDREEAESILDGTFC